MGRPSTTYVVRDARPSGLARHRRAGLCVAMLTPLVAALGATDPVAAQDVDTLREKARAIGQNITKIERRLSSLHAQREILGARIASADDDMRVLQLQLRQARREYEFARKRYVVHAIDAYKDQSGSGLALLLSTKDVGHIEDVARLSKETAEEQSSALTELLRSRDVVTASRMRLNERAAQLVRDRREIKRVIARTKKSLAARHSRLTELRRDITRLERSARLGSHDLRTVLAADTRFYETGVSFEGVASWYGPGFAGQPTANGDIFDPSLMTAASLDLPLGTWLYVEHGGKGVVVLVNDRGPYIDGRILDLSRAAAHKIGITGLGWIHAEVLVEREPVKPAAVIHPPG